MIWNHHYSITTNYKDLQPVILIRQWHRWELVIQFSLNLIIVFNRKIYLILEPQTDWTCILGNFSALKGIWDFVFKFNNSLLVKRKNIFFKFSHCIDRTFYHNTFTSKINCDNTAAQCPWVFKLANTSMMGPSFQSPLSQR